MTHPPERVRVHQLDASSRVLDPAVERAIDETWAGQLADAAARGLRLADAPAYRLESVVERDGTLELGLTLEPYRVHSAMKTLYRDPRVHAAHHDGMLVADGLVRTADDRYLLLSTPKVTGVELQLVGGTASPAQREIRRSVNLFAFMEQRVMGALTVSAGDVEVREILGLVRQEIGCVNVVFDVRVGVAAERVSARDGSELVVVAADELRSFLAGGPAYLPAVAALL